MARSSVSLIVAQSAGRNNRRPRLAPRHRRTLFSTAKMRSVCANQSGKRQGPAMRLRLPFLFLATLTFAAPAQAQNWPTRTVKFIVPFGPGAGADIGARLFAERLQKIWGQPVVIENKPGG